MYSVLLIKQRVNQSKSYSHSKCGTVGHICTLFYKENMYYLYNQHIYAFIYTCLRCPTSPTIPHFRNRLFFMPRMSYFVLLFLIFQTFRKHKMWDICGTVWDYSGNRSSLGIDPSSFCSDSQTHCGVVLPIRFVFV